MKRGLITTNKKILILLVMMFVFPSFVSATTYYVKNSGSDSANGLSDATAWKTLTFASSQLSSGDTLFLKRGDIWTGQTIDIGSSLNSVTIDSYGTGAKPIIDNRNMEDNDASLGPNDYPCIQLGVVYQAITSNTIIRNLDLRGPHKGSAIDIQNAEGTKIYNSDFQGAGWNRESLIIVRGVSTNMVVENCFFDQITGNSEGYSKSIEFRHGSGAVVRNNVFKGYTGGGAVRYSNEAHNGLIEGNYFYHPDTRSSDAWALVVRSQNEGTVIIRNNIIDMTNNGGLSGSHLRGMVFWYDHGPVTRKIFNNVMISDGAGYGIHQGGSTNLAYNNIFYNLQAGWNNIEENYALDTTLRNNIFYDCDQNYNDGSPDESGTITSDPNLANPSMSNNIAQDAKIQSGSSAINTGYSGDSDIPLTDFEGNSRVGVIDIGAFEYGGVIQTCEEQGYDCCAFGNICSQPRSGSGCDSGETCCASLSYCTQPASCGDGTCDSGETCLADSCCNGVEISGDCCGDSDCTIPETCVNNICTQPQTCSQLNGIDCCISGETCQGTDLGTASDCLGICCSVECTTPTLNWDIIDFNCDSLTGWIDESQIDGVVEINPAGQCRFYDGADGFAKLTNNLGNMPNEYTLEFRTKFDQILDVLDTNTQRFVGFFGYNGVRMFEVYFANSGIYLYQSGSYNFLSNTAQYTDTNYHVWRFLISNNGLVEIYRDNQLIVNDASFGIISSSDGEIGFENRGTSSDIAETHIDYLRIATGLFAPNEQSHDADNNPQDGCISITELISYIGEWKVGDVDITNLIEAIGIWKQGC